MDYTRILPRGKNNAVSAAKLTKEMGFSSSRALRADIATARASGQIICSSHNANCSGYYLPATREEIHEFIKSMESQAAGIFKAVKSARNALKEIDGQIEFTDSENKP